MRGAFDVLVSNIGYLAARRMKSSWDMSAAVAQSSGNHSKNYWQVPGPDNRKGFGGACFPKDMEAFEIWAKFQPEADIVRRMLLFNNDIRGD